MEPVSSPDTPEPVIEVEQPVIEVEVIVPVKAAAPAPQVAGMWKVWGPKAVLF